MFLSMSRQEKRSKERGLSVTNEYLPSLVERVKGGDSAAEGELWHGVHLFVEQEARHFAAAFRERTTAEDLAQTGYFAMLDAVGIYDESRGAGFLRILSYCLQKRFAEEVGVRSSRRDALQYASSTDEAAYKNEPDGPTTEEMIEDEDASIAFSCVDYNDFLAYARRVLHSALGTLPKNQSDLLTAYYIAGVTLNDAAELSGYSCKQAAYDASKRALRYLRRGSHSKELRGCLDTFNEFNQLLYLAAHSGVGAFARAGTSSVEAAALIKP